MLLNSLVHARGRPVPAWRHRRQQRRCSAARCDGSSVAPARLVSQEVRPSLLPGRQPPPRFSAASHPPAQLPAVESNCSARRVRAARRPRPATVWVPPTVRSTRNDAPAPAFCTPAQAAKATSYKLRVVTGGGRGEGVDGEAVQVAVVGRDGTAFLRRIPVLPDSDPSSSSSSVSSSSRLFDRGNYDTARRGPTLPPSARLETLRLLPVSCATATTHNDNGSVLSHAHPRSPSTGPTSAQSRLYSSRRSPGLGPSRRAAPPTRMLTGGVLSTLFSPFSTAANDRRGRVIFALTHAPTVPPPPDPPARAQEATLTWPDGASERFVPGRTSGQGCELLPAPPPKSPQEVEALRVKSMRDYASLKARLVRATAAIVVAGARLHPSPTLPPAPLALEAQSPPFLISRRGDAL